MKHPGEQATISMIYQAYLEGAKQGTIHSEELPSKKEACPPPGCGNRAPWKDTGNTHGPIGLLLNRVHECGAYLNAELQL